MSKNNHHIDAYIEKAEPFAKPILKHLRALIHQACPNVEETIKWSFPNFDYKGPLCSMASFKKHCVLSFWKASLLKDSEHRLQITDRKAMGHLGQIQSLHDLPSDELLLNYIKQAVELNDKGIKIPPKETIPKKDLEIPDYFIAALQKNKKALEVFEKFAYSHKKEYLQWITEAKTEATRLKRINTALEWMVEGKGRNWKYGRK